MSPELEAARLGDHIDRLYRAAWALCGRREDAEDLVQETFTRVLGRKRELSGDPLPYLLTVLRNTFVDSLRTRDRRPRTVELEEEGGAAFLAPTPSAATVAAAREVFAAIAELPDDFRDVVVAVDVAGLSYDETASALEVPIGTVMSRLYRGRGRLADRLR